MKNQTESREEEVRQDWRLRRTVPRCKIYQPDGANRGIEAASVIAPQRAADSNLLPRMHASQGWRWSQRLLPASDIVSWTSSLTSAFRQIACPVLSLLSYVAPGSASTLQMGLRSIPTRTCGHMKRWLFVALLTLSFGANGVVIRADVDDSNYRIDQSAFPALADMPGEGHGVLIARKWVLTAAHAAPMEGMDAEVAINGNAYKVARVFVHPGYKRMPDALGQEALKSGDPSRIHAFLAGSDDIALIELDAPVEQVVPVALYRGGDEVTKVAMFGGKGATGNGIEGQIPGSPHRGALRRAYNAITGANDRYLWYRFDPPAQGLPLEGVLGSGDSGGPLVVQAQGAWQVIGLGSWITAVTEHELEAGFYGQMVYNVRISRYVTWIDGVMCAADGASCAEN